ncbi:MAG TPA: glycosyltransferase family A protein [Nevskiaceae bacterium]
MGTARPLVSVIVPAYRADAFIADALRSILAQQHAPPFEVIVAPDDGADYRALRGPRVRVLAPDGHHGVSHARNRAIDAARGELLALCDADDLWPPNYLHELAPLARDHGAACATTVYLGWDGAPFRRVALHGPRLRMQEYARCLASIRPLWRRDAGPRFQPVFAEDVLHTLHLVALRREGLPIARATRYLLRERRGSASYSGSAGQRRIIDAYASLIETVRSDPTRVGLANLPPAQRTRIAEALEFWRYVNLAYLERADAEGFMRFVNGREAELWERFLQAAARYPSAAPLR